METITHRSWVIKDSNGIIIGEFEGVADNDWIGRELLDGTLVASVEQLEDIIETKGLTPEQERRNERTEIFSETLDRINPIWYNSLTQQQKDDLSNWRQAWLDYPETEIRPDNLSWL